MMVTDFPISNRTKNAFIAAGFKTEEDFKNKFLEDLKEVEGIGAKGVTEIREYLHGKFGIVFKHKPKPKKVINSNECRDIVDHFLKHKKFINWANEILIAQRLLNKVDYNTLKKIRPNYKASSLTFYLCADGEKYIRQNLPAISVESQNVSVTTTDAEKQEPVEEVKLNLDLSNFKRPKSIKDFLNE